MSDDTRSEEDILKLVTEIVAAYVSKQPSRGRRSAGVIKSVHATLGGFRARSAGARHARPAVPVKKSVTPDYIVCLEDGKKLKMLKRYLRARMADAGSISRQMEPAGRLSDGRAQLCGPAQRIRQADRAGQASRKKTRLGHSPPCFFQHIFELAHGRLGQHFARRHWRVRRCWLPCRWRHRSPSP